MNTGPREWDAQTYDRVSDPQYEWGARGARPARPARATRPCSTPAAAAGASRRSCSSGCREGRVIGVDGSESMVEKARERARRPGRLPGRRPRRARARRAGRRDLLERDLPLDPRPRRLFAPPARRAQAGRPAGRAVRGQRATSPSTRGRSSRSQPGPSSPTTSQGLEMMWNFAAGRRRPRSACARPASTDVRAAGSRTSRCSRTTRYDFTTTVDAGAAPRAPARGAAPALRRGRAASVEPTDPLRPERTPDRLPTMERRRE